MSRDLDDLFQWLAVNDPARMPYWPGARYTGGLGFRTSRELLDMGASPIHLGVDRAGGGDYLMPFDGRVHWRMVGGGAGSLLRIVADGVRLELQVMHTEARAGVSEIDLRMITGERLPVSPGQLGLSSGIHAHTEVVLPFDEALCDWLANGERATVADGRLDVGELIDHCTAHDLPVGSTVVATGEQIRTWAITHLWPHFAVRAQLPYYRGPDRWEGPTMLVDSSWLLRI